MDNINFYEQFDWSKLNKQALVPKIKKILELIPDDVFSIADIGCGNGIITNVLNRHYDVTAVDRSKKALSYVEGKSILASSGNIPLETGSFDMVFSSEMLEHIDEKTFQDTIKELKRLSKKYIFITVPNGENPAKLAIQCPKCGYIYNRPNHLRSFNVDTFKELFPEYKIVKTLAFGPKTRYYNPKLLNLKLRLTPSSSWIPYYWIPKDNRKTFCPRCEHSFEYKYKFNPVATFIDIVNVIISKKKPYWLFVLMEKKDR